MSKYSINFIRSQKTVEWDSDKYGCILELAEANDIYMDYGCRAGCCLTCMTKLISGEVDHSDADMPPEEGECLPCVGIPLSDLELDA